MSPKLKYIDLQNFQSYKRARIPLTDMTFLIGKSSSGKTAVFRAALFLLYGEWDTQFPHDPTQATAVAFEFENGTRVLRIRKEDGTNQAAIIRNGETVKYKSFGTIIPGIESLINVHPIKIGAKAVNINFSLQDDPAFMVLEPRPAKAQWIGRLYGAHIITQMMREMAKDKKQANSKCEDAEERLGRIEQELASYATIEEQEVILGEAKALLDSYTFLKQCQQEANTLEVITDSFNRDKWVAKADTKGLKADIDQYLVLGLLKQECDWFKTNKAELKKSLGCLNVDVTSLRKTVEDLAILRELAKEDLVLRIQTVHQGSYALEISHKLTAARALLEKELISNDKCPVCNIPLAGLDRDQIMSNVAKLVGCKH